MFRLAPPRLKVLADRVLLQRVHQNDYENDERYCQANYDEHQLLRTEYNMAVTSLSRANVRITSFENGPTGWDEEGELFRLVSSSHSARRLVLFTPRLETGTSRRSEEPRASF